MRAGGCTPATYRIYIYVVTLFPLSPDTGSPTPPVTRHPPLTRVTRHPLSRHPPDTPPDIKTDTLLFFKTPFAEKGVL